MSLKECKYEEWFFENEDKKSDDETLKGDKEEEIDNIPTMLPIEGDGEKVKEGKSIKILTPSKLITTFRISSHYNNRISHWKK